MSRNPEIHWRVTQPGDIFSALMTEQQAKDWVKAVGGQTVAVQVELCEVGKHPDTIALAKLKQLFMGHIDLCKYTLTEIKSLVYEGKPLREAIDEATTEKTSDKKEELHWCKKAH